MKRLYSGPHVLLWLLIPLIWTLGYLACDDSIDINIHDTYYVIERSAVLLFLSLICATICLILWRTLALNKKLSRWSNLIIVVLISAILISLLLIIFQSENSA